MANIALLSADTTNLGCTRVRDALVGLGHTVTLFADSGIATADFTSHDLIVTARTTYASRAAIATRLRTELAAGKPVLVGGWESGQSTASTNTPGLITALRVHTSIWSYGGSDSYCNVRREFDPARLLVGTDAHVIGTATNVVAHFASSTPRAGPQVSRVSAADGTNTTALLPDNVDLDGVPFGGKLLWFGWMLVSTADFNTAGLRWLEDGVNWLLASEADTTPLVGKFYRDFAGDPVQAGVPADISARHAHPRIYIESVETSAHGPGKVFQLHTGAVSGINLFWPGYVYTAPGFVADGEVLALVAGQTSGGGFWRAPAVVFRLRDAYGPLNGYAASIYYSDQHYIRITRLAEGVPTNLAQSGALVWGTPDSTAPRWIRARFVGSVLQAKLWRPGDTEPVDWLVTYDTTGDAVKHTTGWTGVAHGGINAPDFLRLWQIGVASDGGTAPAEPVPVDQPPDTPTLTVADLTPTSARLVGSPYSHPQGKPHIATEWDLGGTVVATGPVTEYLEVGLDPATQYTGRRVRYKAGE
jgi:hypothetical protein